MSEHLTFHNSHEQRKKGHQPTVLLERSTTGNIVTATATGQRDENGVEYYAFIENGEEKAKPLGRNTLSDQTQDILANQLAGDRMPPLEHGEYQGRSHIANVMGEAALGAIGVDVSKTRQEYQEGSYSYLRDLLPPVTRPAERPINYDVLLSGTDEELKRQNASVQLTSRELEQKKYYDRFVTDENKQASQETLAESLKVNTEIGRILRDAGVDVASREAVDVIRENPDVRYAVAKYFTQKIESMAMKDPYGFGERIQDNAVNNLKEDPQTGVKMMSRDYVVSLSLKMLGGEYSEKHADQWLDRDETGRVILGQHRDAARRILFY